MNKVSSSVEMPKIDGREEDPKEIVRRIIKGVELEEVS